MSVYISSAQVLGSYKFLMLAGPKEQCKLYRRDWAASAKVEGEFEAAAKRARIL